MKNLFSRIKPILGLGPGSNYPEILVNNWKYSKCGYLIHIFLKYLQKGYKRFSKFNVSKLPVFTYLHIFAFLISRFVKFTFNADHLSLIVGSIQCMQK